MARALPAPALRPYVREYVGWWEHTAQPICRREPPTEIVPLIINFGSPVCIFDAAQPSRWTEYQSFTTGVFDTFVLVGTSGPSGGLQINLTIPGARLVLGLPLRDLANRIVALDDVFGAAADRLVSALLEAPTWEARFDLVERELTSRLAAASAHPPSAVVMHASRRLLASNGRLAIAGLAGEVGCSEKHLAIRFREELGVTPKMLARILRFGAALERIKRDAVRLSDLALDCGYYDQAHFDRDFRAFAGVTPTELRRQLMPDGGGVLADR